MKILFLTYHGFEEASGISKKMLAQIKGLRQNGHEVALCYYGYAEDGSRCRYVDNRVIANYGRGKWAATKQRMSYDCIYDYCVENSIEMVYARSFMNASPSVVRLFKRLRRAGIRSVMEIPTYPYDQEFDALPLKYRVELFVDKMFRRQLAAQVDAIVTFSGVKTIFGQRTINISNGVDFDVIPLHNPVSLEPSDAIHMIGVAEVHPWHGFDRMIAGLGEYYKDNGNGSTHEKRKVVFHIVGGVGHTEMNGAKNLPGFANLINRYGLQDKVVFHGKLFGDELTEVFDQCVFAVGSLARHRSGITHIKTLKNREYACRGIPFVYSECDSDFDDQPYILKVPADESPIDIRRIVDFVDSHQFNPADIRKTVEHLSWKKQMERVEKELSRNRKDDGEYQSSNGEYQSSNGEYQSSEERSKEV